MKYTKEHLEGVSCNEINSIVELIVNFRGTIGWEYSKKLKCLVWSDGTELSVPDYCNNWADMGPLAFDGKISILNDGEFIGASNCVDHFRKNTGNLPWLIKCYCDNPLRAAAIVYILVMQGGE